MLPHFIAADTPVLFIGPPGVGKTEILTTYAKSQGIYAKVIHGSHYTPTDVLGIGVPDAEREYAKFLAPELFRELREAARHGQLFILLLYGKVKYASAKTRIRRILLFPIYLTIG